MFNIILIVFLLLVVAGAFITIFSRDLFTSVMGLGATGFSLAVVFLIMKAPEAVTAQIVVEIFTFAMLLVPIMKMKKNEIKEEASLNGSSNTGMFFFIAIFLIISIAAWKTLPEFGSPLMKVSNIQIAKIFSEIHVENMVTGILLDFRAYNTVMEVILLLVMVIGISVILRKTGRKSHG